MLEEAMAFGPTMEDGLGRTVTARYRFAREWALGDRKSPQSSTPALVLLDGDPDVSAHIAPFRSSTDDAIPATLHFESRLPLSPPDFSINSLKILFDNTRYVVAIIIYLLLLVLLFYLNL